MTDTQAVSPWSYAFPSVLAALSALGAAFLANYLGQRRESARMVEDRAFRETVDWYFRITRTMADFMFLYAEMQIGPPHKKLEHDGRAVELSRKLTAETIESCFYAPIEAVEVLQTLQANLNKIETSNVTERRHEMQRAHFALSVPMRKFLGLEPLPLKKIAAS
jgi:hypothetical protein